MSTRTIVAFLLIFTMAAGIQAVPAHAEAPAHEPGQVVVKLAQGSDADIAEINLDYGTSTITSLLGLDDIFLLDVPAGTTAEQMVQAMAEDARLLYVELNYINESPEDGSTDRTYGWGGEDDAPLHEQDAVDALQLDDVHEISTGAGTVVAVVDTGVQLEHPALVATWTLLGYDFVDDDLVPADEADGHDDDGDGRVDEAYGHGTHVAGIVNLVAPDARIMPLRVLNADGRGNNFKTASAILYAAHNGAGVINLSLGTPHRSVLLRDVTNQAARQGVVVVAAAGNLDSSIPQYPAAEVCALSVTSVSHTLKKSSFANYGEWISVAAPGESVYSTFPVDGYAWWSGTSMATPFAAGHAALLRSINGDATLHELGAYIGGTAQSLDAKNPDYRGLLGAGHIDILASLTTELPAAEYDLFAACD